MHIYPMDYKPAMVKQWIANAVEMGNWSIDIRFNAPSDIHNVNTDYVDQTDSTQDLLGEISQTIIQDSAVDGSIVLNGMTAIIHITKV